MLADSVSYRLYALMRREAVDCAEFVPAVMLELMEYLRETGQTLPSCG